MMRRFVRVAAVGLAVVCLLTGCSAIGLNVESQLFPPDNGGEQDAIRTALDAYVVSHTASGETADYTLKYPSHGEYLSAFITLDQVKEHTVLSPNGSVTSSVAEAASSDTAIAFYRRNAESALAHINLLKRQNDGTWTSVADVEGKGEAVNRVDFGDLNNDGVPELLIGWSLYNTKDSRLSIYDLGNDLNAYSFGAPYTDLIVTDLTGDGADDLLLLNILTGTHLASAQLYSFRTNGAVTQSHVMLDSEIISFGEYIVAELSEGVNGVFLDCYKEQRAMITELIYCEDGKLSAPLCDQTAQLNSVTTRELLITSRDIDGDGTVEWPVTTRMPGFEEAEASTALWHAEWCYWNHATKRLVTDFTGLIPANDLYMLRLRDEWQDLPAAYTVGTRTMTLYTDSESGDWLFRISVFSSQEDIPENYSLLKEANGQCYAVCIADTQQKLTTEDFHYLFYCLSEEDV